MRRLASMIAIVATAGACSADAEVEETDGTAQHVESRAKDRGFVLAAGLGPAAMAAQRATAVVLAPFRDSSGMPRKAADGTSLRATCGSTFVSRRHAITAAHCVSATDVPGDTRVVVELVDVSPTVDWASTTHITGAFPAFRTQRVTRGYRTTDLRCRVKVRCGEAFGPLACPLDDDTADIALLECDSELPADRAPVRVAARDDGKGPVQAFWFHEIYDITTEDLYRHYTLYSEVDQNLHYFGDGRNQVFPLTSQPWPDGSSPRRLGAIGSVVQTDLFGCHGTSGSGVFQENPKTHELELLGPVALGGAWASERLCVDPELHAPGDPSIAYTSNAHLQRVAALAR